MTQYICLNHGECNWADEKPPREFTLPDDEENICPNCESANIRKAVKGPTKTPRLVPVLLLGLVVLASAIWWEFHPSVDPFTVKIVGLNCETGVFSLTTTGGDNSQITFGAKGLSSGQTSKIFTLSKSQRRNSKFIFFAVQNGDTSSVVYITNCPKPIAVPVVPSDPITDKSLSPTYRKVEGSEFCVGDCILAYSEIDNLGHIREKRIADYAKCCPAGR